MGINIGTSGVYYSDVLKLKAIGNTAFTQTCEVCYAYALFNMLSALFVTAEKRMSVCIYILLFSIIWLIHRLISVRLIYMCS